MPTPPDLSALHPLSHLPADAPLDAKLDRARLILEVTATSPGFLAANAAVAFTGGKDSSVVLTLWAETLTAQMCGPLRAISVDTGFKFPQVTAFRDKLCDQLNVELILARPQVDLAGYPVAQNKLSCCRDLKIVPLGTALAGSDTTVLFTGIRRDEHPSRAARPYVELRPATETTPEHWQVNPILDWTEIDIWAFITGRGLPYCELYHEGYRSLGCMPCTTPCEGCVLGDEGERAGRDQDKERQLDALKSLGYF